jgi:hypothetical protein
MKRILPCFLAAALAVPAVLSAAMFEGKVNFTITTAKGPQEITYNIKGDKLRIDMPGAPAGAGGIIIDTTKHETTVVMDAQHMYMVQKLPDAAAAPQGAKAPPQADLQKTGEKEKILGYEAEKYISTSPDGAKAELWLAEGLGSFVAFGSGTIASPAMGGPRGRPGSPSAGGQAWERALAGKDLFPLRCVNHDKDGKEFRLEATAIDKQSLPDSLFAPPAGYQKFDMEGMMKGAMPGGFPGMPKSPGKY